MIAEPIFVLQFSDKQLLLLYNSLCRRRQIDSCNIYLNAFSAVTHHLHYLYLFNRIITTTTTNRIVRGLITILLLFLCFLFAFNILRMRR